MFSFSNIFLGGFYSDTKAYVSESRLQCPGGTFVPYNKAPGKRARDCIACPQGKYINNVNSLFENEVAVLEIAHSINVGIKGPDPFNQTFQFEFPKFSCVERNSIFHLTKILNVLNFFIL